MSDWPPLPPPLPNEYDLFWRMMERLEEEGVEINEDMAKYIRAVAVQVADIASMFEDTDEDIGWPY